MRMLDNKAPEAIEDLGTDLALLDEMDDTDDAALYDVLPELGLGFDESLGALGAVRKRRKGRRVKAKTIRKLRKAAKRRKRTAKGRFAGLAIKGLGAPGKKRRRRGVKKATLIRRGKRIAKKMKRSKRSGRFVGLKGLEGLGDLSEISGDFAMMDEDEGLGALAATRRRRGGKRVKASTRRKLRRAAKSRRRRKSGRFAGLGYLANVGSGFGQLEIGATMPIVGAFQWLATGPGLEALGGVALAPVLNAVVSVGLDKIGFGPKKDGWNPMGYAAGQLITAIGMWELGKAVGSPNIAKFGAFFAMGKLVETLVTNPLLKNIEAVSKATYLGLGTMRVEDSASIGSVRIPDAESIGSVRIPDAEAIGDEAEIEVGDVGEEAEVEVSGEESSDLF